VSRFAARIGQEVGRDREEAGERDAARDILDVRRQPAILVEHQHGRARALAARRRDIAFDRLATRDRHARVRKGFQPPIVGSDDRGGGG
jgi:hypothetical protein